MVLTLPLSSLYLEIPDRPRNVIRNQIDLFLFNARFDSTVRKTCTYPGADVLSDYVLLVAVIKMALSPEQKSTPIDTIIKSEIINRINI